MNQSCVRNTWQHTIIDYQVCNAEIGTKFRHARPGAEDDLVRLFLEKLRVKVPPAFSVTFFKEPRIDSGVPDIVGVIWHKSTADKWNINRIYLHQYDIRVMHYISQSGINDINNLQELFGKKLKDSIAKLDAAEMIRQRGSQIFPLPLSKLYATRHIFAIEAKISEWRIALNQAFLNRWFATTSYVLLPRIPSNNVFRQANALGVGVWSSNDTLFEVGSLSLKSSPESYASWLFNEWAWKASFVSAEPYAKTKSTVDHPGVS